MKKKRNSRKRPGRAPKTKRRSTGTSGDFVPDYNAPARKYRPGLLTVDQRRRGAELVDFCQQRHAEQQIHLREYEDFCGINGIEMSEETSLVLYTIQMTDRLGARSTRNYLGHVKNALSNRVSFSLIPGLDAWLQERVIRAPRRHARDLSKDEAIGVLMYLLKRNRRVAAIAVFMIWSGLRFADSCTLERRFIRIRFSKNPASDERPQSIEIDLRLSKTIKRDILRTRVVIPGSLCLELPSMLVHALQEWYFAAAPEGVLALGTVTHFNGYMPREGSKEHPLTSYSFRRFALQGMIKHATDEEGITDWERAARFTLHMKVETLQAFYQGDLEDEV